MSFVWDGIENAQVLTLPDGVRADGRCVAVSGAALVTWHSSQTGMFHQVYLNGRFAGATVDAEQRRLVVQTPGSLKTCGACDGDRGGSGGCSHRFCQPP